MLLKKTLKYPVLTIGILLFGIYACDPKTKKFWSNYQSKFIPSTCRAIMDRVEPKAPDAWDLTCKTKDELLIDIDYKSSNSAYKDLRVNMYKTLANSYVELSKIANLETMEHLKIVRISIKHKDLNINSITDGQAIAELSFKKTSKDISAHLKLTVKIKETR